MTPFRYRLLLVGSADGPVTAIPLWEDGERLLLDDSYAPDRIISDKPLEALEVEDLPIRFRGPAPPMRLSPVLEAKSHEEMMSAAVRAGEESHKKAAA